MISIVQEDNGQNNITQIENSLTSTNQNLNTVKPQNGNIINLSTRIPTDSPTAIVDVDVNLPALQHNVSQDTSSLSPCPHCGGLYKGAHGVAIHISRAHPPAHRDSILSRQSNWKPRKSNQPSSKMSINSSNASGITDNHDTSVQSNESPGDADMLIYKRVMTR